ncbi:MAG: YHS domain-containing protein [Saprospiraceae bacterium]|nr:YHS domain-containing protein [Saprospiraceae bacterium]
MPEEVAISIIAQIIEDIRKSEVTAEGIPASTISITIEDYYTNPVCNIPVHKSTAKHIIEYRGEKVYFCCDGCKVKFEQEPEKYLEVVSS